MVVGAVVASATCVLYSTVVRKYYVCVLEGEARGEKGEIDTVERAVGRLLALIL